LKHTSAAILKIYALTSKKGFRFAPLLLRLCHYYSKYIFLSNKSVSTKKEVRELEKQVKSSWLTVHVDLKLKNSTRKHSGNKTMQLVAIEQKSSDTKMKGA